MIMKKIFYLLTALFIASTGCIQRTADEYFLRGISKEDLKDYKGAIADFTKVIKIEPLVADAYNNRGNAKYNLKDYSGAIADINKAIELNPLYTKAFFNSGKTKTKLLDYKGAIADFTRAIELNPNEAIYYIGRGKAKLSIQDYRGTITDYTKANELEPGYSIDSIKIAILGLQWNNKGDVFIIDSISYTDWETEQLIKVDYTKSLALLSSDKILITYDVKNLLAGNSVSVISLKKSKDMILPNDSIVTKNLKTDKQILTLTGFVISNESENPDPLFYMLTYNDFGNINSPLCITLVIKNSETSHMKQFFCHPYFEDLK